MKASKFVLILLMTCTLSMVSCGSDDDGGGSDDPPDPSVACDEGLCASNADLKAECEELFSTCIEENPDVNSDECAATALIVCEEPDEIDVGTLCDRGLCIDNDTLRDECETVFTACIANEPEENQDECVLAAILKCNQI
jgi:hypothetical protein